MDEVVKVSEIPEAEVEKKWLIEGLWLHQGVGIIGGEPKSYKTFMGIELAVSVATGKPALNKYPVMDQGRALIFAAEDSILVVKERIISALNAKDCKVDDANVYVITQPKLLVDSEEGKAKLTSWIEQHQPKILLLDPFVRIQQVDENVSTEVAKVLSFLRSLNRQCGVAIMLVHHARKRTGKARPGQNLRGSSEFHAWGDSNLYVKRVDGEANTDILLTTEHRSAQSMDEEVVELYLPEDQKMPTLRVRLQAKSDSIPAGSREALLHYLEQATGGLTASELRSALKIRNSSCKDLIQSLIQDKTIKKTGQN